MKDNIYKHYRDFYKKAPPNVKGDFYSIRNTIGDKFIPKKDQILNSRGNIINEANDPDIQLIPGLPVNRKVNYNNDLMVKAIQYGLVLLINYAGDKDNWKGGRERVIYPMVIGVNRNTGNVLIRGWHLTGWSVSKKRNVKKEWRLFKASNIKSMMFTGDFYRLAPKGYKMNDRVMTQRTIKSADFNEIRRNQEKLVKSGIIGKKETIGNETSSLIVKIDARTTDTTLDLTNPFNNQYIEPFKKKPEDLKMTFMKNINKNEYVVIIGALGTMNRTVKLYDDKEFIGNYKVRKSITGDELKKTRNVDGHRDGFPVYTFNEVMK